MPAELLATEQDFSTASWPSFRFVISYGGQEQQSELRNIVLLAPPDAEIPAPINRTISNVDVYKRLLCEMQRLRGRIALEEGAVQRHELTADLRHIQLIDYESWHALALNEMGAVCGCARFRLHRSKVAFGNLGAAHCALAQSETYGPMVAEAVEKEIAQASYRGIGFAEVGGWAVDRESQRTQRPITLALVIFALARRLGHCISITTASRKSSSASILRRLGGESLHVGSVELPPYFDPHYGCEMELLRFDSMSPAARWRSKLLDIEDNLAAIRIAAAGPGSSTQPERVIPRAA